MEKPASEQYKIFVFRKFITEHNPHFVLKKKDDITQVGHDGTDVLIPSVL